MEDDIQWKMTSNGRLPQMLKGKYLNNYWSDLPQISNLGLCDQNKLYKYFKWRWPPMEDDLKRKTTSKKKKWNISATTGLIFPKLWNLGLCDQTKLYECFKLRWPTMECNIKWKTTSNIESEISQQLLVGFPPNFKLKLKWSN
jgi:hypothetical protein